MRTDVLETSEDAVLGGRLRLRQPLSGHRVGHDAILLAAATGGRAGEHAVDLGAGVGARRPGAGGAGRGAARSRWSRSIRRCARSPPAMRGSTGLDDRVEALAVDVEDAQALAAAGLAPGSVDRVLMNPPFHDATRQNLSPDPRRRLAHAAAPGLLPRWIASAARSAQAARRADADLARRCVGRRAARAGGRVRRYRRAAGLSAPRCAGDSRAGARGESRAAAHR